MTFIGDLGFYTFVVWSWTLIIWQLKGSDKTNRAYHFLQETRTAFKVALVIKMAIHNPQTYIPDSPEWLPLVWGSDLAWIWIVSRVFKDDDRWKKRRKKAAAKVRELAGRLVVVPEPIPVTGK